MNGFFLMTNNYLVIHKKHYEQRENAIRDLLKIIKISEIEYKKELLEEAEKETNHNKDIKDDSLHNYSKQKAYNNFNGFTEDQLDQSIKLIVYDGSCEQMFNIFLEKPAFK